MPVVGSLSIKFQGLLDTRGRRLQPPNLLQHHPCPVQRSDGRLVPKDNQLVGNVSVLFAQLCSAADYSARQVWGVLTTFAAVPPPGGAPLTPLQLCLQQRAARQAASAAPSPPAPSPSPPNESANESANGSANGSINGNARLNT